MWLEDIMNLSHYLYSMENLILVPYFTQPQIVGLSLYISSFVAYDKVSEHVIFGPCFPQSIRCSFV